VIPWQQKPQKNPQRRPQLERKSHQPGKPAQGDKASEVDLPQNPGSGFNPPRNIFSSKVFHPEVQNSYCVFLHVGTGEGS
jgi:hypothetical protein